MWKEFWLREIRQYRGGLIYVGETANRTPIAIGDRFLTRFDLIRAGPGVPQDIDEIRPSGVREISLTVSKVEHFRTAVDFLPIGHAGALWLTGWGAEFLTDDCYLSTVAQS